jgi:hypothetical protein
VNRCLQVVRRVAGGRGVTSAALALALLLALLSTREPVPDAADGTLTLGPPPPAAAAPAAPQQRAAAPRPAAPPRRIAPAAAPRPRAARAAAPAPVTQLPRKAVPAYGAMDRRYSRNAHGEGLCAAQDATLALTCRGAEVRAGSAGYVLRFQVCTTTADRFELRFLTEAEVEMTVRDTARGQVVWTWQPPRPFLEEEHVLVAEVGSCWVWQTPWAQVDDAGRRLPDGSYELQVDFLEVEDTGTYSRRFVAQEG